MGKWISKVETPYANPLFFLMMPGWQSSLVRLHASSLSMGRWQLIDHFSSSLWFLHPAQRSSLTKHLFNRDENGGHTCTPWGSWIVRENLPWKRSLNEYPVLALFSDLLVFVSADTVNLPFWKLIWTSSFEKPGNSKVAVTTFFSVSSCRSHL